MICISYTELMLEFDPSENHDYSSENIKIRIESTDIKQRENYETCAKRLY